ncbi:MAG: peptidyl-prolyl cis-trans isomerase [Clostridia bacterium]|nr:peptidyl-prolyl cis-trans isomerase [Clostridia bacterium]
MNKSISLKKRVITAMIAGTLALATVASGCGAFNKTNENTESTAVSNIVSGSEKGRTKIPVSTDFAAKTEHFQIATPIANFLFNSYYENRRDAYSYQGLDVTKDLKDQYYDEEGGVTWFDFFMNETKKYLGQVLVMCESAREDGIELDDKDMEDVKATMDSIESAANAAGESVDDYIVKHFSESITRTDLENYLQLTALANKYYTNVYNSFTYTDEQYEKYFEENKTSYQYADFLKFNFVFPTDSDSSDSSDSKAQAAAEEKAKAFAEDLAKCKTEKEFKKYVKTYLTNNPDVITSSAESSMSDSEVKEAIETAVNGTLMKKYPYEVTSDGGKWLFDLARKEFDSTVIKNTNSYTAFLLLKPAYRDESVSRNVRHILFTPKSYGGEGQIMEIAFQKANEVYNDWKKNDPTEEHFAELAKQYSDDGGSKENGGLYENVKQGDMVAAFDNWLFSASRKPGDSGIVQTEFGYHIMYYIGSDDTPTWKKSMDTLMRQDSFNERYEELSQKYTVQYNDDAINTIEESEYQESSAITYNESSN